MFNVLKYLSSNNYFRIASNGFACIVSIAIMAVYLSYINELIMIMKESILMGVIYLLLAIALISVVFVTSLEAYKIYLVDKAEKKSSEKEVYTYVKEKLVYNYAVTEGDFMLFLATHKYNTLDTVLVNSDRYSEFKKGDYIKCVFDDYGGVQIYKVEL